MFKRVLTFSFLIFVSLVILGAIINGGSNQVQTSESESKAEQGVVIGKNYDILASTPMRLSAGEDQPKKINETATAALGEVQYLSVDSSTTVVVHQLKDGWAEVQVTQPEFLRETHRGWIPLGSLKVGSATNKMDGWIRKKCLVHENKSHSSAAIGELLPPAAVGVADDGSGWLRIIHGPVRASNSDEFLPMEATNRPMYIESSSFTTTIPSNW